MRGRSEVLKREKMLRGKRRSRMRRGKGGEKMLCTEGKGQVDFGRGGDSRRALRDEGRRGGFRWRKFEGLRGRNK